MIEGVRLLKVLTETTSPVLKIAPFDKIIPKHDALNARESFYLEPFRAQPNRKVGHLLHIRCGEGIILWDAFPLIINCLRNCVGKVQENQVCNLTYF